MYEVNTPTAIFLSADQSLCVSAVTHTLRQRQKIYGERNAINQRLYPGNRMQLLRTTADGIGPHGCDFASVSSIRLTLRVIGSRRL